MRMMTFDYDGGIGGVGPRRAMPLRLRATPTPSGESWSLIASEDGREREFLVDAMVQTFFPEATAIVILPIEGDGEPNGQLTGHAGRYSANRLGPVAGRSS